MIGSRLSPSIIFVLYDYKIYLQGIVEANCTRAAVTAGKRYAPLTARPGSARGRRSAVLLQPGGAQSGEAMRLIHALPGPKFLFAEKITAQCLFETYLSATDGHEHLGLAVDRPRVFA
jgi:hypothetical protein